MNIDNTYDPTNISKNYLSGQEFTNQVSIEQGFNVELFEVSDKLAFIKNFGNVAVFKDESKGLLIDTGMWVSSNQVINKLKEWGIDEIEYIIYTHGHVDHVGGADLIAKAGHEYPTAWLKEQGWGKKAPAKKAPAKAEPAKAKAQEPVENKAAKVKKEDK